MTTGATIKAWFTRVRTIAVACTALGGATFVAGLATGHGRTVFAALVAGWLFTAGMAAGAVAVAAAIHLARGEDVAAALPIARAPVAFFVPAWLVLAFFLLAQALWTPAAAPLRQAPIAALVRDLTAGGLLFVVGWRYAEAARAAPKSFGALQLAIGYLLIFVATFSLWAVDLVLGLTRSEPSTVIPPLVFVSAFIAGLAWVSLVASTRSPPRTRHDLGALLFGFVALWAYLSWAAYLPVWYGNLPDETAEILSRWAGGYRFVTATMIGAVFVFPFLWLLSAATKRGRISLAIAATSVLVGLLGEAVLLILPAVRVPGAGTLLLALLVLTGMLGLFVLSIARLRRGPARYAGTKHAPPKHP